VKWRSSLVSSFSSTLADALGASQDTKRTPNPYVILWQLPAAALLDERHELIKQELDLYAMV